MSSSQPPPVRISRRAVGSLVIAILFLAGMFQFVLERPPARTTEEIFILVGLLLLILVSVGLGHSARRAVRRNPELRGEGLARLGLILSYVGILLLFLTVLFPEAGLKGRSQASRADEELCTRHLRGLHVSLVEERSQHPDRGFPAILSAPKVIRGSEPDDVLFSLRYEAFDSDADGIFEAYELHADPPQESPVAFFFVDETGIVRRETGKPANRRSPPVL